MCSELRGVEGSVMGCFEFEYIITIIIKIFIYCNSVVARWQWLFYM